MYLKRIITGGMDWHDIQTQIDQLMENGSYVIKDATSVIVKDMMEELPYLDKNRLRQAIENKSVYSFAIKNVKEIQGVKCYSECDTYKDSEGKVWNENHGNFDGAKLKLSEEYAWGQVNYTIYYVKEDWNENEIKYLVEEQFLCPTKGVPVVERFYKTPFDNLQEAKAYYNAMKLHENMNCRKSILVCNPKTADTNWFGLNMKAIELMQEKGYTEYDDNFSIYPKLHVEKLMSR